MLYIIAGTSLSGKTTARRHITKKYGVSGIDTDSLRTMTNYLRPDILVGHDKSPLANYENMRQTITSFLQARSFFAEDYLIEGDCINLEDIRNFSKNHDVRVVVLGYPRDSVSERLAVLKNTPAGHWSQNLSDEELKKKITEFINFSAFLENEAKRFEIKYIDVSKKGSLKRISKRVAASLSL